MMYGLGNELGMFEEASEAAGIAWWVMELPLGVVFFSPNKTKMLGRKANDFKHYTDFTTLVHPDDFKPMMQAMQDHIDGKSTFYETSYRIQYLDGSYRTFYDRGKIVGRKGKDITVAGIVFDISSFDVSILDRTAAADADAAKTSES